MRTPSPLPELPEQFTTTQALAAGASRRRLRSRDLHRIHGVRFSAGEPTFEQRCRMLALRIPEHAFFSHSTAARLWGMPLPWRLESHSRLHVGVPSPAPRLHSRHVEGHRLEVTDDEITTWGGLRLTTAARTWLDLATLLELPDLVAVGDYVIHRRAPFADRVELARMLGAARGQRGVRLAREALALLDESAESRPESLLRVILVTSGLPTPRVNHAIVDSDTGEQVRPDFTFPNERVILEYQGDYHRTRLQWRRDMTRRTRLESKGWRVMEINADDLKNPAELVARIRDLMALAASVPNWSQSAPE